MNRDGQASGDWTRHERAVLWVVRCFLGSGKEVLRKMLWQVSDEARQRVDGEQSESGGDT
jgi:hypothetical protein